MPGRAPLGSGHWNVGVDGGLGWRERASAFSMRCSFQLPNQSMNRAALQVTRKMPHQIPWSFQSS
jgi:hypothetical protein